MLDADWGRHGMRFRAHLPSESPLVDDELVPGRAHSRSAPFGHKGVRLFHRGRLTLDRPIGVHVDVD
eukprot:8692924-Pyramimonas_sp.AAC.1